MILTDSSQVRSRLLTFRILYSLWVDHNLIAQDKKDGYFLFQEVLNRMFGVTDKCACNLQSVADWPTGQSLFLMSHPDVSLVNILLSIIRVSLVQNKFVFCQLRVHYIGDPGITETYLGIQHVNILQYLHELNGNVYYINISNVPMLNCAAIQP